MADGISSSGNSRRRRSFVSAGALAVAGTLALMVGAVAGGGASAAATRKPVVLRVMVTNDDGVGAPGIDAAVQALRKLPRTSVTVVAPLTNQSGTGGKTTAGRLVVTKATTASGYPATAVHGYPADTVVWAVKDHGIGRRPDLVVSGINFGENVGPLATVSGTVGAAREAVRLGIPALAASQGVDNGSAPDFAEGAAQLVAWVTSHRAALVAHRYRKPPAASLNVPTCPGTVRGPVSVPLASTITGVDLGQVDCTSTTTTFANDAQAFVDGYAALSPLYPASSGS
jgi:5'-nucleotidase